MRPRTLEEAISYDNFALLRKGTLSIGIPIPDTLPEAYQNMGSLHQTSKIVR